MTASCHICKFKTPIPVKYELLMALTITTFWDVAPCSLIASCQCFKETYRSHFQRRTMNIMLFTFMQYKRSQSYHFSLKQMKSIWVCVQNVQNLHTHLHHPAFSGTTCRKMWAYLHHTKATEVSPSDCCAAMNMTRTVRSKTTCRRQHYSLPNLSYSLLLSMIQAP
jgi:hypothetical protein